MSHLKAFQFCWRGVVEFQKSHVGLHSQLRSRSKELMGHFCKLHHQENGEQSHNSSNIELSLEESLTSLLTKTNYSSEEEINKVENLVRDIQQRKLTGSQVQESINSLDMDYLLNLSSPTSRKKFLNFLVRKEKLKLRRAEQQAKKHASKMDRIQLSEHILTPTNTIIRRGQSVAMDTADTWNLAKSLMFGLPLLFDLSYDHLMNRREIINTVLQLNQVVKINKTLRDPFHVYFTNAYQDGHTNRELERTYGKHYDNLMVSIMDKRPHDIFPANQLVYLTADSPYLLPNFDLNKIYIIGGFVDRIIRSNASLQKANEAGIPHARLPLDEHLRWHKSTKNLTLDQMMRIVCELRTSGDWIQALQHVPSRKHLGIKNLS